MARKEWHFVVGVLKQYFVETGYLSVIGLRDIMCNMAASPRKAACEVKRGYIIIMSTVYI